MNVRNSVPPTFHLFASPQKLRLGTTDESSVTVSCGSCGFLGLQEHAQLPIAKSPNRESTGAE